MNYQIQGLSIHAEVHGTAEPALVFLHYWGGTSRTWRMVTAELEGQFKTVAYDARGWGKSDKTLAGYKTGRPCGRSSLTGQSAGNQTIRPGWTFDGRQGRAARRIAEAGGPFRPHSSGSCSANASA
jgi:pimeloyl-ACP methyl ester carboxylesterase